MISSPLRIGSWPEVKTWLPDRTAGMYDATGFATSGTSSPSCGEALLDGAHAFGRFK